MTEGYSETDADRESWLASLAAALPIRRPAGVREMTLPAVVRECELWSGRAPLSAWARRDNAKSLLADCESAVSDAGPAVRRVLGEPISDLTSSLQAVISANASDRPGKISAFQQR